MQPPWVSCSREGREQIALMRRDALLINTSRGEVLDVNAVADAARTADKPSAAAQTCTRAPAPIPRAATAPAGQPWVELRPTM